ncbi:MAG: hypothetical protein ABI461_23380, partial [Polyangiaceae bacterium]
MSASVAYEELLSLGAHASAAEAVAAMRRTFEARTGAFGPEDAWFEARGQAFWDDALTTQRFGTQFAAPSDAAAAASSDDAQMWCARFERAHRGLFRAVHSAGTFVLEDQWGGAEFSIDAPIGALASALEAACGDGGEQLFDGR